MVRVIRPDGASSTCPLCVIVIVGSTTAPMALLLDVTVMEPR